MCVLTLKCSAAQPSVSTNIIDERTLHGDAHATTSIDKDAQQSNWRFAASVLRAVETVGRTITAAHPELVNEADALENVFDSRFEKARLPMQPIDVCIVDLLPRIRTLLTKFASSELCCGAHEHVCATIAQLDALLMPSFSWRSYA